MRGPREGGGAESRLGAVLDAAGAPVAGEVAPALLGEVVEAGGRAFVDVGAGGDGGGFNEGVLEEIAQGGAGGLRAAGRPRVARGDVFGGQSPSVGELEDREADR